MTNISSNQTPFLSGSSDVGKTQQTQRAEQKGNPLGNGNIDVMALAYYYLVESASTSAESALVQAKRLRANAESQELLNEEAAQFKWNSIPKLASNHHKVVFSHVHWTWEFWKHDADLPIPGFLYKTGFTKDFVTHPNEAVVQNVEAKNNQISAQKQFFTNQISSLQMEAQRSATTDNSISQEAAQTMQEGASLLQIVRDLTFKALIRQPVQN